MNSKWHFAVSNIKSIIRIIGCIIAVETKRVDLLAMLLLSAELLGIIEEWG